MDRGSDQNTPNSGAEQGVDAADTSRRRTLSRRSLLRVGGGALCVAAGAGGYALLAPGETSPARRYSVPPAPDLLVRDVSVVDPLDGSVRPGMSVLVRDGRIVDVSPTVGAGQAVTEVDGGGRFVVPGYNNMHSHALNADRPGLLLATMLAEGVTGFRQMGGSPEMLADRAAGHLPLGAHAPGLLAMPGTILMPLNAGSAQDAISEIGRQKQQGADFIKITAVERDPFFAAVAEARAQGLVTAGHLPSDVYPSAAARSGYTCFEHMGTGVGLWVECSVKAKELTARASTVDSSPVPGPSWAMDVPGLNVLMMSRMQGRLVNPSAHTSEETRGLIQDALDSFDPQRCRAMARVFVESGTWQVPTLVRLRTQELAAAPEYSTTDPWLSYMTDEALDEWRSSVERFRGLGPEFLATFDHSYATRLRVIGIWHEEGVRMMTGTDGQGRVPGQSLRQEFGELAQAGVAPLEILRMATIEPAAFLGRSERMGRVASGMDADFLLLDSDPLQDVRNLMSVAAVVRAGHYMTRNEMQVIIADHADMPADPRYVSGQRCC